MGKFVGKDYSELEGREVKYISHLGIERDCVVTGCDEDIGLSVQEKETNMYILCLNGPSSPLTKKFGESKGEEQLKKEALLYKELLRVAIQGVLNGVIHAIELDAVCSELGRPSSGKGSVSSEKCAFNQ